MLGFYYPSHQVNYFMMASSQTVYDCALVMFSHLKRQVYKIKTYTLTHTHTQYYII